MAAPTLRELLVLQGGVRLASHRWMSISSVVLSDKHPKSVGSFATTMGAHGALIDGPDYTFVDGRSTPLRAGQRRRAVNQRLASNQVIQLLKETKFAISRHANMEREAEEERHREMTSKLKPKGQTMIKK